MLEKFKADWQHFKTSPPGQRFQERYQCHQRECEGKPNTGKLANVFLGLLLVIAGIIMIPAPGPGAIIACVGLALIGSEFLPLARFLDKAEVRLRPLIQWPKHVWAQTSFPLKALFGLLVLLSVPALAYGAYHIFVLFPGDTLMEKFQTWKSTNV